jgi:hypothetical protein
MVFVCFGDDIGVRGDAQKLYEASGSPHQNVGESGLFGWSA